MGENNRKKLRNMDIGAESVDWRCRQFYDLLEAFRVGGNAPDTNYLFLGDYQTRLPHSSWS